MTQEFGELKEHIDERLTDWMSKTSFHGHEEEQHNHDEGDYEGDYVLTIPSHPQTSTSLLYEQEDHLTVAAPMQRPRRIRKQSQFLQTPYTNRDSIRYCHRMTLIFDPMCDVDHQKRKMFMR